MTSQKPTLYFFFALLMSGLGAQTVTVTPPYPYVGVGAMQQFAAKVEGLGSQSVTWSLTGMGTNNPKLGSISASGLYTAPAVVPAQNPITVIATGADGKTVGTAYVLLEPLGPTLTSIAPNPINVGSYTVTVTGQGFQKGAYVMAGGISLSVTYVSPTQLTAVGYQGASGNVAFQVKNPGTLYSNAINVPFVMPITVSPASASVALGASRMFSVSGQTVTWTSSAGTITPGGVFTAPMTMPASSVVTIIATGSAGQTGSAKVTLTQPLTQVGAPKFTPPAGTYTSAQTLSLSSETAGASIRYTVNGSTPSESVGTLFNGAVAIGSTTTIKAIAYKTGMSSSAVVSALYTINVPAISVSVSPLTASLSAGQTQSLTAMVTGSSNTAVNWTLSGLGSLSATTGSTISYLAPANVAAQSSVKITATSAADPTKLAVSTITLNPTVVTGGPITVSPSTISVALNGSQTFTASGQPSVTWTASAGSITPGGVFTAPGAMTPTGLVIVTATGTNNQSASATVTLTGGTTLVSSAAAKRFLQQAAFGPTSADVAHVQAIGLQAWINEQYAMPKTSGYAGSNVYLPNRFLTNAVMGPDQLRQRVAFALSQITVVSLNSLIFPTNVIPFQEMLSADAFTNYRQILGDVTLSAAMGEYLTMVNNAAANPALGTVANENYAREIMQLFSLGTNLLNPDGSPKTDSSGNYLPTYDQKNVTELARVFTGWTYAQKSPRAPYWGAGINDGQTDVASPMVAMPIYHDAGSKTLLPDYQYGNGTSRYMAPAGLTAQADLSAALDNIFYHPNTGPFIGKQLIQHLVKSNPSPQYIANVAAAFANNGHGVRGDMQAVITAVLMDPEARANDLGGNDQSTDGHMQEPALFLAGIIRAFNGTMNDQNYFAQDLANMGQDIYNSGSVFNYYAPTYVVPQTTLTGGEFQIFNTFTSIYRANLISGIFGNFSNPIQTYGPGTTIDLTSYVALSKTPAALVDALDLTLTRGLLPAAIKSAIVAAIQPEDPAGYTNGLKRVQAAIYLIATSNYYNVSH